MGYMGYIARDMERKRSVNPGSNAALSFGVLDRGSVPRGKGAVLCLRPQISAIDERTLIVPIWMI